MWPVWLYWLWCCSCLTAIYNLSGQKNSGIQQVPLIFYIKTQFTENFQCDVHVVEYILLSLFHLISSCVIHVQYEINSSSAWSQLFLLRFSVNLDYIAITYSFHKYNFYINSHVYHGKHAFILYEKYKLIQINIKWLELYSTYVYMYNIYFINMCE